LGEEHGVDDRTFVEETLEHALAKPSNAGLGGHDGRGELLMVPD
jgi:hypothetical protein